MLLTTTEMIRIGKAVATPIIYTAAREFIDLQNRSTNPRGKFKHNKQFFLEEKFDCCAGLRTPSCAYPLSEMSHGRTALNVAHSHGIGEESNVVVHLAKILKTHAEFESLEDLRAVQARLAAMQALKEIATTCKASNPRKKKTLAKA